MAVDFAGERIGQFPTHPKQYLTALSHRSIPGRDWMCLDSVQSQERKLAMASKRERIDDRESCTHKRSKPIKVDSTPLCSYSAYDDEDHDASSVGSNQIVDEEIIFISDDEAESSPPKGVNSIQSTDFPGSRIHENMGSFTEAVEEREKEGSLMDDFLGNVAEKERMFWENYLWRIIDNNGNLLGEFSRLDDDLIIRESSIQD